MKKSNTMNNQKITPCLWVEKDAKAVAIEAMRTAFSHPLPLKANAAKNIDSPKNKCHATSSIANIIDGHSQPRNRT